MTRGCLRRRIRNAEVAKILEGWLPRANLRQGRACDIDRLGLRHKRRDVQVMMFLDKRLSWRFLSRASTFFQMFLPIIR